MPLKESMASVFTGFAMNNTAAMEPSHQGPLPSIPVSTNRSAMQPYTSTRLTVRYIQAWPPKKCMLAENSPPATGPSRSGCARAAKSLPNGDRPSVQT